MSYAFIDSDEDFDVLRFVVSRWLEVTAQIAFEWSPATEVFRDTLAVTEEGCVRRSALEAKDRPMVRISWRNRIHWQVLQFGGIQYESVPSDAIETDTFMLFEGGW